MADRLERSEMLRRRAASDIAHDLATPATVLESQLQAMIDGVVPTDPAGLEAARSAAAALAGVVADIDDLARAEAAPLQATAGAGRPERRDPGGRARARRPAPGDATATIDGRRRAGARSRGPTPVTSAARCATSWPTRSATARTAASWRWPRSAAGAAGADPRRATRARASRRTTSTTSSSASTAPTPPARPTRDRPADRARARPDDRPRAAGRQRRPDRGRADRARRDDLPDRAAGARSLGADPRREPPLRRGAPTGPGLDLRVERRHGPAAPAPRSAAAASAPVISRVPRPWVTNVQAQRTRTTTRFEKPIR